MSDVLPDWHVEQQRLRSQIMSLQSNMERQRLELMEMVSRRKKTEENILATRRAIMKLEADLAGLIETHGDMPSLAIDLVDVECDDIKEDDNG